MSGLFKNTYNTRAILPGFFRFIRSDVPGNISEKEIQWLVANRIRAVVDLREESEHGQRRCPLEGRPDFWYVHLPVTGGGTIPELPEQVSESYICMVDEQMQRIVETIWNAETNVLYFCNAGKDRTGVVSALLLMRTGAVRQTIIDDYMKSAENLKDLLYTFADNNPQVDIRVITPQKAYMEAFLSHYGYEKNSRHPSWMSAVLVDEVIFLPAHVPARHSPGPGQCRSRPSRFSLRYDPGFWQQDR